MKLNIDQQAKIVLHVADTYTDYKDRLQSWHSDMADVYENVRSFKQPKKNKRETSFKVNKAHEIENKALPKVLANDPKWIVSYKNSDSLQKDEETVKRMANGIRDYLHTVFMQQDMRESIRIWAKAGLRYGLSFTKTDYKYKIGRTTKKEEKEEVLDDGDVVKYIANTVDEKIANEYPCVDVLPITDIYFDPRYLRLEDMPSIIAVKRRVRLSSITQNKKKYMNVDKIVESIKAAKESDGTFRDYILSVTGIKGEANQMKDENTLQIKCYYGYYDVSGKDDMSGEKLYEFWTLNDLFLIYAEERTTLPFEDFKCFDDTETFLSTGIVQPIIGLQDELNFKKNATATYINQSLYRSYYWSPQSGINPKRVNSAHGNLIPTSKDRATVENHFREVPHRSIPGEVFSEQNDFERQIQALTYTIDTGNPMTQQALTNTATGAKIKAFESNAVYAEVRKHLEESLAKLAYKILDEALNNIDSNIIIKEIDGEGFWQLNKEAFRDAINKYDIVVESGSSSYDSEDKRREDALARWNLLLQAKQVGVPVNLEQGLKDVLKTMEKADIDKLFEKGMPQLPPMGNVPPGPEQVNKLQQPLPY